MTGIFDVPGQPPPSRRKWRALAYRNNRASEAALVAMPKKDDEQEPEPEP